MRAALPLRRPRGILRASAHSASPNRDDTCGRRHVVELCERAGRVLRANGADGVVEGDRWMFLVTEVAWLVFALLVFHGTARPFKPSPPSRSRSSSARSRSLRSPTPSRPRSTPPVRPDDGAAV